METTIMGYIVVYIAAHKHRHDHEDPLPHSIPGSQVLKPSIFLIPAEGLGLAFSSSRLDLKNPKLLKQQF